MTEKNKILALITKRTREEPDKSRYLYGTISLKDYRDWSDGLRGEQQTIQELFHDQVEYVTVFENHHDYLEYLRELKKSGLTIQPHYQDRLQHENDALKGIIEKLYPETTYNLQETLLANLITDLRESISKITQTRQSDHAKNPNVIFSDLDGNTLLEVNDVERIRYNSLEKENEKDPLKLDYIEEHALKIFLKMHRANQKSRFMLPRQNAAIGYTGITTPIEKSDLFETFENICRYVQLKSFVKER